MKTLMVCALAILGCAVASAQGTSTLQQRYSHIQHLNNAGYELINTKPHTTARLHQAIAKLQQSREAIAKMQADLAAKSRYLHRANERYDDNLRIQADAYALLGDKQKALDTLDAWAARGVADFGRHWIATDKNLDSLRNDARFKALVSRVDAVAKRWNADALTASTGKLSEAQRLAGLSLFWSEVRYNFVHFAHVPKLDWNQTYLDYLPKVMAAKNLHDYYAVLMRLAPLLHDGHTNIYPPKSIRDQFYAHPPIRTALIRNKVIVTWIANPRVAQKGLKVGDEIVSIDGEEVHRYAEQHVEPYVSSSTPQDRAVRMYDYQLLAGDHRKPIVLGFKGRTGKLNTITLSREPDSGAKWPAEFNFRMLPGDIAYLKLGEFEDNKGAKLFKAHLSQILKAKGLILDVRDNGGGNSDYGWNVLTWLSKSPVPEAAASSLDYIPVYRAWNGPSDHWKRISSPNAAYSKPRKRHFTGPVAVLIGPRTFSAAEDFVVSFVAMHRGILVGEPTAGSTGQPLYFKLPGGGSARVCTLRETFPDGRRFVDRGIAPNIQVAQTVADFRAGRDPVIAAAVKALAGNTKPPN